MEEEKSVPKDKLAETKKKAAKGGKASMAVLGVVLVVVCCVCSIIAVAGGMYVVSDSDASNDDPVEESQSEEDTSPPDLKIVKEGDSFVLLDDYTFEVEAEEGAKIFVDGEEVGEYSEGEGTFTVTPKDGENKVEVYAEDEAGNKSEVIVLEFTAYAKKGAELISCAGVSLPLNTSLLRVGYSGFKGDSLGYTLEEINKSYCEKGADYINLQIKEIGTLVPCVACDGGVTYIDLSSYNNPYTTTGALADDGTVISEKSYTTVSGIEGRLVEVKYDTLISLSYSYEFIFSVDGVEYGVVMETSGSGSTLTYDPTQKAEFMKIVDALVIE